MNVWIILCKLDGAKNVKLECRFLWFQISGFYIIGALKVRVFKYTLLASISDLFPKFKFCMKAEIFERRRSLLIWH